jgi:hypothetical protein
MRLNEDKHRPPPHTHAYHTKAIGVNKFRLTIYKDRANMVFCLGPFTRKYIDALGCLAHGTSKKINNNSMEG